MDQTGQTAFKRPINILNIKEIHKTMKILDFNNHSVGRKNLFSSKTLRLSVLTAAISVWGTAPSFADVSKATKQDVERFEVRNEVLKAYPGILDAMMHSTHSGFGGDSSRAIANHMYSRTNKAAVADAKAKIKVEPYGEGTWFLRLPYVNIAVFETAEGLVLVDAGYAPAGPALLETIRKLSNKPIHTLIITHHHADHGFGAWALLEAGEKPRIIATDSYLKEMELDIQLANYTNVYLNNQDPRDVPRSWDDATRPTETFSDKKTLTIGGEEFILTHAPGETVDQLWVSVPGRKIVVSADYHQPFLPNAGNGKRRQRYAAEWAQALRDMAAQKPDVVLPMHGPAMTTPAEIQDKLKATADMLDSVVKQVTTGLNAGKRQYEVAASIELPDRLKKRDDMDEYYNRIEDVGKMVLKQYSGWWDDVPSHWTPAPMASQAKDIVKLAGGIDKLVAHTRSLLQTDPVLACHMADWAYFAAPNNPEVLQVALEAYAKRIEPGVPAQEINVYLSHMTDLKWQLNQLQGR